MPGQAKTSPAIPHRGTVALLELDDQTDAALRSALGQGYLFKEFDAYESLLSALSLGSVKLDALVIGHDAVDALDVAMAVRSQVKQLQTIVLAERRDVDSLRRRAEIQSENGDEVQIWPCQHLEELPGEIRKAIKRSHRRVIAGAEKSDGGDTDSSLMSDVTDHLDRLLERAPIGMLTVNAAGEVRALNKQARTIMGVRRGQMLSKPIFDFFPVFEQQKLRRLLRENVDDGEHKQALILRTEVEGDDDEHEERHVEVILAGNVTRSGDDCTMLILHDVSSVVRAELARKQTAAALQASEDRFLELAEVMRMVPWEADPETLRLTYIGKLVEELMGYPRSRWLGRNFWIDRLHEEDRQRVVKVLSRDTRRLQNFDLQFRMHTADGETKRLRNIVNVVRNRDGQLSKLRGFIIDITQLTEPDSG